MNSLKRVLISSPISLDVGLLFLRLAGSALLFYVHGWPKIIHYHSELQHIEDPFGLGAQFSLWFAVLAEVLCPIGIALGLLTRLATLPVLVVLGVALVFVHADWSIADGQFAWLLLIIYGTIALAGPGAFSLDARLARASA